MTSVEELDQVTAWFDAQFGGVPALVILRGLGIERSVAMAEAAWAAGFRAVEIPVQKTVDLAALHEVARIAMLRGRTVGAGTVTTIDQLGEVAAAGASYVVSPGFDTRLVSACLARGIPPLPGVATASEVQRATSLGLTWLKAFPASVLGPTWFTAMLAPFPSARFVATGGVGPDNAEDFLNAGAHAVAVSSAAADPEQLLRLRSNLRGWANTIDSDATPDTPLTP